MKNISQKTLNISQIAMFGAIIFLLAFTPFIGYIPLGVTRATIIHVPVIIGSIMLGPKKGAILGLLFGITSFLNATFSPTITSFAFTPFYSVGGIHGNFFSLVVCFVPRILVGVIPYYVFKLFYEKIFKKSKRQAVSIIIAAVAGSLTNTLLVMNLIFLFFSDNYAAVNNITTNVLYNFIISIMCINGIPEALLAAVITVAVCKPIMLNKTNKFFI